MNNLTIKEIAEKVNATLQENFDKPVIPVKLGRSYQYDTENGRDIITSNDLDSIIRGIVNKVVWTKKGIVEISCIDLFKIKRKKSEMRSCNSENAQTITAIEILEGVDSEKTLEELIYERKQKEMRLAQQQQEIKDERKEKFIKFLEDNNVSFDVFESMVYLYNNLSYADKDEFRQMKNLKVEEE
jgi:hypothetical protein